ncbi:unnamed protein product [Haemonchus placei]|uniref:TRAF-type domain-containing protein n=1 Tax=Haemonchus placei TaxID=6290 RepID=A0A0N4X828_HAEPC|nr:unnamed protein product [Haemonchus placei]
MAEEEQNVVEEEVPAESDNNNQQQQQEPQQQQGQEQGQPAFDFEGLRRQIPEEKDLSLMYAKIQRILGRTDAISSMKNRIDMIHVSTLLFKSLSLHVVEHSVQSIKDLMEEAMDALKQILNEIQAQVNARQGQDDPHAQAMQPGPSWAVAVPVTKRCAFCDGDHYACDCGRFYNLRDRRRCLSERDRCERCLLKTTHLATSCPATSTCFYCKSAKREKEMYSHHSAFCPFKFPMSKNKNKQTKKTKNQKKTKQNKKKRKKSMTAANGNASLYHRTRQM